MILPLSPSIAVTNAVSLIALRVIHLVMLMAFVTVSDASFLKLVDSDLRISLMGASLISSINNFLILRPPPLIPPEGLSLHSPKNY
jgi:hypothetical protein